MNRIKFFRRRKDIHGWTQQKLAEKMGVKQQYISIWERGIRPIPERIKPLIAEALGEGIETVFPDSGSEV